MMKERPQPLTSDMTNRMTILITAITFTSCVFAVVIIGFLENGLARHPTMEFIIPGVAAAIAYLLAKASLKKLNKTWSKNL